MARQIASTVRHFLKTQVLRQDYVIVSELPSMHTRLPYAQKLERMHSLCISHGYLESGECERIRRRLYADGHDGERPANLLLIESYLPACIAQTSENDRHLELRLMQSVEQEACKLPCKTGNLRSTRLELGGSVYLMCLPLEIHFLLMENDGALLAA